MKIRKWYRPELVVSKGKEPNPLLMDPYLDVKAERLLASNGHALVSLPVEVARGERSRYLACSLLEAARKLGEDDVPAEIKDQEIVEFGVLWPTAQERTFPDWRKLVPTFRRGDPGTASIALNARLLKHLADAMGTGDGVSLTFSTDDPATPVLVSPLLPDADELGLLMPLMGDDEVDPDQRCPACRKLLAAGAPCPEHGAPALAERVLDAAAALGRTRDGTRVSVSVGGKTTDLTALAEKRDATKAKRAALERQADEILKNAGAGELTRADTKGEPVARRSRKGGR